ncbi:hypothetical protein DAPPUDRAFT_239090 [Daphnia pulex]|uniref:Uncharacterized protein n=1 Tax=Daphnia pulex TaxID=6669 RepID=E9G8B0_DAPPU|nr:hypothetical protein DAPPUDRAFT_239090 [Daphnia pulex]|eukprot:EFX84305.1 hypothetical protein DAPPUDRAFT_239090 [Daphnia pulex]
MSSEEKSFLLQILHLDRMRTILLPIHWIHPRIRNRPTPPRFNSCLAFIFA